MADTLAHPWQRLLRSGLSRLRVGDFEAAEHCFERAHRMAPRQPEVCCALGRERLRRGRLAEAEALLTVAASAEPPLSSAVASLARLLGTDLARDDEALALLDDRATPEAAAIFDVVRAEIHLAHHRHDEAARTADAALAAAAGDAAVAESARVILARIENQRGVDLVHAGDAAAALFAFKRATDLDPAWSAPHCNMGNAFCVLERAEPARAAFDRALELGPDNLAAHHNRALLAHRRDHADALDLLADCLRHDPGDVKIACALAARHRAAGRIDDAIAVLEGALDAAPESVEPWLELARTLADDDDLDGAETCLRQAIAVDPDSDRARRALASALVHRGAYREAAELLPTENVAGAPSARPPVSLHSKRP